MGNEDMSGHETSQRRFCRLCNRLLPKNVLLEDHELEVHGIVSDSKSPSSESPSPVAVNKTGFPKNSGKKPEANTPKRKGTSRKSTSVKNFACEVCGKMFPSAKGRDRHAVSHTREKKRSPSPPPRQYLHCFECNSQVEKQVYITHLMFHDTENKDKAKKGSQLMTTQSVTSDRKYIYLNPDDPRRLRGDAILQCPSCPTQLFFSTRTFTEHTLRCKKNNNLNLEIMEGMQMLFTEIKREVMLD